MPVVKCKVVIERGNIWLSDLFTPIIVNVHIIDIRDGKEWFFQIGKLVLISTSDDSAALSSEFD